MQDLSRKSIPLLISKLTSAIVVSQRGRDVRGYDQRRDLIKEELALRGEAALEPLMALMRNREDDVVIHAADVIGRIGAAAAVVPLAQILAQPHAQHVKRSAARALLTINTPDAVLAVNIWQNRVEAVRSRVRAYLQENAQDDALVGRLGQLAGRHQVGLHRVAESYMLLTTTEKLSSDAQARLDTLRLSPAECAYIEEIAAPTQAD